MMLRRQWLLGLALAGAIGISIVAVTGSDGDPMGVPVMAREHAGARAADRSDPAEASFELPRREPPPKRLSDLFAPYSWVPPPLPPPPPPPPPPPRLPYTYAGRLVIGSKVTLVLLNGTTTLAMAVGDRAGEFQLESVTDEGAAFRHIPTGESVSLVIPRAP